MLVVEEAEGILLLLVAQAVLGAEEMAEIIQVILDNQEHPIEVEVQERERLEADKVHKAAQE